MIKKIIKKYYLFLAVLGLTCCWIFLNALMLINFDNVFADMTDSRRYSLTSASRNQAKELLTPLYITVYYSNDIVKEDPVYARYAEFVLQFLKQYQKQNPEKILITIKDPLPFSESEKEAQNAGLKAFLSADGQTNLYFGAIFTDSEGRTQIIDSFSKERDFWLEKDITLLLRYFNHETKCVVGMISPIHKMISRNFGQEKQTYAFVDELSMGCNILPLATNISEIPLNVDVLILVTPQKISQNLMYALDQYVLRGGHLIILADKWIENPQYKTTSDTIDTLNRLLKNWGLRISDSLLGSQIYGKQIYIDTSNGERLTPYPLWLDLTSQTFNFQNKIMEKLKNITMRSPLEIAEQEHDNQIEITPLITIEDGMLYPYDAQIFDKREVVNHWQGDGQKHILAALSSGKYNSIFNTPPETLQGNKLPYLYASRKSADILVIGDSDFIRDDVWLDGDSLSDNGQMLLRAIDIFRNRADMADIYKSQIQATQDSLGKKLYQMVYKSHSQEIARLQYELQNIREEYTHLRQAIENNKINIDASLSQRLTSLEDKAKRKQERLKFLDYEMKQTLSTKMQGIILINLIVFPIILLGILLGGYSIFTRYRQKRIREKYHAR